MFLDNEHNIWSLNQENELFVFEVPHLQALDKIVSRADESKIRSPGLFRSLSEMADLASKQIVPAHAVIWNPALRKCVDEAILSIRHHMKFVCTSKRLLDYIISTKEFIEVCYDIAESTARSYSLCFPGDDSANELLEFYDDGSEADAQKVAAEINNAVKAILDKYKKANVIPGEDTKLESILSNIHGVKVYAISLGK